MKKFEKVLDNIPKSSRKRKFRKSICYSLYNRYLTKFRKNGYCERGFETFLFRSNEGYGCTRPVRGGGTTAILVSGNLRKPLNKCCLVGSINRSAVCHYNIQNLLNRQHSMMIKEKLLIIRETVWRSPYVTLNHCFCRFQF